MIKLKHEKVNFCDYSKPEEIALEAQVVQERARTLEGCSDVRFELNSDQDGYSMFWVYYRKVTEEEKEKQKKSQFQGKMAQYLRLKKELNL